MLNLSPIYQYFIIQCRAKAAYTDVIEAQQKAKKGTKVKKFAASLTNAQYAECRKFEAAGLATLSQAVKAFERGNASQIAEWRAAVKAQEAK